MSDEAFTMNTRGLDQLLKALKAKQPSARLGILGSKAFAKHNDKSNSNPPTNAEVGAVAEFGTATVEKRSWLRQPLIDHLDKEIESSGALDQDVMNDVIRSGTVTPWLNKIAILGERIVAIGFQTGGYGKWAPWKNPNYTNNTGQILVDSTQLRESVSSEVKDA